MFRTEERQFPLAFLMALIDSSVLFLQVLLSWLLIISFMIVNCDACQYLELLYTIIGVIVG